MVMNLANISGQSVDLINETISVLSGEIHVMSGFITIDSGLHVLISGQPVTISGDHVFVESGVHVIIESGIGVTATIDMSGTPMTISGDHVFVESGVHVVISGQPIDVSGHAIMIGRSGILAGIDLTDGALETVTYAHHEIHEGKMWHSFCQTSGLADNETNDLLIVTGSGQEIHAVFEHGCEGAAWYQLLENVNLSGSPGGSGLPLATHCMNRYVSGTPKSTLFTNPSTVGGVIIDTEYVPGGTGPKTGGAGGRGENEWILTGVSGPVNYIARLINVGGAAKDVINNVEFYEKRPGY